MSDPKDTTSFFRKVVKFVANPSTDWTQIAAPADEHRETEFAKGELKAMIERKRRNDFVRKREFDMLRKVRREGLTSEQLAALGGLSRIDDAESRLPENGARAETGVKAKIDEIEQQMVGDASRATTARGRLSMPMPLGGAARPPEFYSAPTEPATMDLSPLPTRPPVPARGELDIAGRVEDLFGESAGAGGGSRVAPGAGLAPLTGLRFDESAAALAQPFATEPVDVEHDPELDEAVIAFANADFEQAENALLALTGPGGTRLHHADTWLVLFDLYRAVGEGAKFESLAIDYAQQFGWSAPQWFSMPRLVAEMAGAGGDPARAPRLDERTGWVGPEHVDADEVARLTSLTLQMPLPWVFDWGRLRSIDVEGCARLSELFRNWLGQAIEMRWLNGERLFEVLAETAPTGARDVDPAYWQLRLDGLRMTHRPDRFDEAAIDYCMTYEVSPPSWEPARCQARISGGGRTTTPQPLSVVSDGATSILEPSASDEHAATVQVGSVELAGQLIGDIGSTLRRIDEQLGTASIVNVSCARLIRVDFIAAGDLLNWVLARRTESRTVRFLQTHRMVALFFGAMGINEHATVKVRTV